MEQWKDIKGFEGFYQISNQGRIRSIAVRRYLGKYNRTVIIKRERMMHPTDNEKGYLIVSLKSDGVRTSKYIHRLVAEHFIENPNCYKCVNHKDFNVKNNNVDNLEWCTQKQNVHYSIEHMRHKRGITWKQCFNQKKNALCAEQQ